MALGLLFSWILLKVIRAFWRSVSIVSKLLKPIQVFVWFLRFMDFGLGCFYCLEAAKKIHPDGSGSKAIGWLLRKITSFDCRDLGCLRVNVCFGVFCLWAGGRDGTVGKGDGDGE